MPASFDTLSAIRAKEARRVMGNALDAARRAARVCVETGTDRATTIRVIGHAAETAASPAKAGTAFAAAKAIKNGPLAARYDGRDVSGALHRNVCKVRAGGRDRSPVNGPPAPPVGTLVAMAEGVRSRTLCDMHEACQLFTRNTGAMRKAGLSKIRAILHTWGEDPHNAAFCAELQEVCRSYKVDPARL